MNAGSRAAIEAALRARSISRVLDELLHGIEPVIPDEVLEWQNWRYRFCHWANNQEDSDEDPHTT